MVCAGVPEQSGVTLRLPALHLQHPLAIAPGPPLTRLQLEQMGLDPADATHLLPEGVVLACLELLPLGLSGPHWSQHSMDHIRRYLDYKGCVAFKVTIGNIN